MHRVLALWAIAVLAMAAPAVEASYHTFVIDELYSNADGTVQYVVLRESQGADGENHLQGQALTVTRPGLARSYVFDHDLPSAATAGRRVLIATSGFAALNLIAPDYVIPDRFLPTDGATVGYAGVDQFAYPPLPTDGVSALYRNGVIAPNSAAAFSGASGSVAGGAVTAVEFYNPGLDHYFVSALAPDIEALDSGRFPGWYRTGETFRVFPSAAAAGVGASPVCRFYIPPQHGDSHFLSPSPAECSGILQRIGTDPNYSGYLLESANAFYVVLPDPVTGVCPAGTVPVYRLWNQRADSNHRYTSSLATRTQMIARGYIAEGYGPAAVVMCGAPPVAPVLAKASDVSPFSATCDAAPITGALYINAEVEPRLDIDPRNPDHFIGVWQQDRWSDGGARGLLTGVSLDAGRTWTRTAAAFSRCTGGNAANGADYARASDPWITISPDGTAHQISISFTGPTFGNNAFSAVMVSRSVDGGFSWSSPIALIRDQRNAFDDKESITADPTDARYVYAVWDRLQQAGGGPTWFSRTTDGGSSWEPARMIFDSGTSGQTLNNQIVVLPAGTLINFFTKFDTDASQKTVTTLGIQRSADHGVTWSDPVIFASLLSVGVIDPETGAPVRDAADLGSISVGRDGRLAVVWQDSRFSAGIRDAVAYSQSTDGGVTWSAPARINAAPGVQAFVPTVKIRDDGVVGVTYYDFRNNTSDPLTLPTDYWLTQSVDGMNWRETHIAGPFDMAAAPNARGLFLGDYQGLASTATTFVPFFAQVAGNYANASDIFVGLASLAGTAAKAAAEDGVIRTTAEPAGEPVITPAWRERLQQSAQRALERRWRGPLPGMQVSPGDPQ